MTVNDIVVNIRAFRKIPFTQIDQSLFGYEKVIDSHRGVCYNEYILRKVVITD